MKFLYTGPRPSGGVRPLTGAGIEMVPAPPFFRGRSVRPLTGAGIEMLCAGLACPRSAVRPLTGAGIEIVGVSMLSRVSLGSPPHGGGN